MKLALGLICLLVGLEMFERCLANVDFLVSDLYSVKVYSRTV